MEETIRLGLMSPLSGLVEIYGPEIVWAARIACDEVNEQGGLLGRRLEIIIEDDGSLPDTAVPAAKRLLDVHGCVALIGNLLSNSRIDVVAQVAEPQRIPLLNFSFYEGSISSRYFFHFAALPNQQIDKMIPFMAHRYGPKMFFAGNNYEWPRGSIDAAKRVLETIDGDVVGEEYLPIGASVQEIDQLLDEVARSGADVFVPYFAGADQITLLTRFTEMALKPHMAVVMGHYDEMMVSRLPPEVREGFYSSNTYFMSLETPESQAYLERLSRMPGITGIWPQGNGILSNFGEGAYICVHAFANAVRAAGTTNPEALVAALEQVQVVAPQGLVEMDSRTHHAKVNAFLTRCNQDGSFTIIERFGPTMPLIPKRYQAGDYQSRLDEARPTPEITARLAMEVGMTRRKLEAAQQILSIADMAILATNSEGVITEANRSACQMFGYKEEELKGLSLHLLLPPHVRQHHALMLQQFVAGAETERKMSNRDTITGYRRDGSFFPVEASIAKFHGEEGVLLVVTLRDITEHKKAEDELTWRATHDALTGLPNRVLIRERLTNALHRSRRNGLSLALLFIDLDGFKSINDIHGHEAGDFLLKMVSARLLEQVRPGDTVARLAGDEFVILCEQLEQPAISAGLAERISETLRQGTEFNHHQLFVTASIGVAIGTGSTHSAEDMLRHADTAMYAVKEKGRNGWQFFNERLQQQAKQRLVVTNGLRYAIERQQLSTRFQPIVAADSGQIVGGELLLRWNTEEGEISPAVFIPVAEMSGSIVPIGAWVFREACKVEVEWRLRWKESAPYVSVNLSTRQLNEANLADEFAAIVKDTGAHPARILLEITETSLMSDVESNLRILRQLAEMGFRVAVDDFGTGYSSLSQLSRLPVSVLKIDKAFIDGIDKSPENRTIVQAIIGLGRSLQLKLVAEGVETYDQYQELETYGCDLIQGYYFSRPLEVDLFVELFERDKSNCVDTPGSSLYFLIYASRASKPTAAAKLFAHRQRIISANRANGITGCLVHEAGQYLQMLEGQEEAVLGLLKKLRNDPEHCDLKIVIQGPAKSRIFREWGMTFNGFEPKSEPDFGSWRKRQISLLDLAEDAQICYSYLTAYSGRY